MNISPETAKEEAKEQAGKVGRRSKWSIKKAQQICKHIRRGIPLRYAAPLCGVPWHTARDWTGEHEEFGPMMEEAHSAFVRDHVGNIERFAKINEKPSQWLLERRARQEFAPAYTDQAKSGSTLNVLALGNDALGKLMQGWSGMIQAQSQPSQVIDITEQVEQNPNTEPSPSLLVHNSDELSEPPPTENLPQVSEVIASEEKKQALPVKEVKVKRGRGRPRKYPKPDGVATPPTPPTPII